MCGARESFRVVPGENTERERKRENQENSRMPRDGCRIPWLNTVEPRIPGISRTVGWGGSMHILVFPVLYFCPSAMDTIRKIFGTRDISFVVDSEDLQVLCTHHSAPTL